MVAHIRLYVVLTDAGTVGLDHERPQPLAEVMQSYLDNGGTIWACGACTGPRGITEADLIPGAKIVTAVNLVEQLAAGAVPLNLI